jgi:hypothetical protein
MYKMAKNESIMQRLKKGTTADDFLAKKKLKKKHQNACIFGTRAYKTAYEIGKNRLFFTIKIG